MDDRRSEARFRCDRVVVLPRSDQPESAWRHPHRCQVALSTSVPRNLQHRTGWCGLRGRERGAASELALLISVSTHLQPSPSMVSLWREALSRSSRSASRAAVTRKAASRMRQPFGVSHLPERRPERPLRVLQDRTVGSWVCSDVLTTSGELCGSPQGGIERGRPVPVGQIWPNPCASPRRGVLL
jgi:hypothetical protein